MSSDAGFLHLPTGSEPYERVVVNPVVVFNVLDHWMRRPDTKQRVIGSLLGSINEDGSVEIRNCFPVPHSEGEQIRVNLEYHRNMTNLHLKIAPEDQIVGWYATGNAVLESSGLIHNFYQREMAGSPPVHLLLNTDLSTGKLELSTYHAVSINLGEKGTLQQHFLPLANEYSVQEHEKITFESLSATKTGEASLVSDLNSLETSIKRLLAMLESVGTYVDDVAAGKVAGNNQVGRFLQETLALLPTNSVSFDQMFTNGVQDVLMVIYLANLTRSHLLLAEKMRDQTPAQSAVAAQ